MSVSAAIAIVASLAAAAVLAGCSEADSAPPASAPATSPTTGPAGSQTQPAEDELTIDPINHSAVRFAWRGRQYYVDPAGKADWAEKPKADAIFITHEHGDHLSPDVIDRIRKEGTVILGSAAAVKKAGFGEAIEVGQSKQVLGIAVEAVPAYNLTPDRLRYHPKERKDNGYVLTFGDMRVYVAGDTEGASEMKALKDIDVAFLPINLPYTMTPAEAAEAARAFRPKVLYPYHQGRSDPAEVKRLLADVPEIEVRILPMP